MSETPDTPSTEALPGLAAQVEWQIGKAYANGHRDGLSCGVESAGLGFTGCDHLTEDGYRPSAIRQEAADTSGHRLIFAAASAVNSEPMLYCSCGAWQWTTAVRDVDLSHFRGQEAADTSGLRETVSEVAKALYAWGNVESSGRATSYARALATALEGATDE